MDLESSSLLSAVLAQLITNMASGLWSILYLCCSVCPGGRKGEERTSLYSRLVGGLVVLVLLLLHIWGLVVVVTVVVEDLNNCGNMNTTNVAAILALLIHWVSRSVVIFSHQSLSLLSVHVPHSRPRVILLLVLPWQELRK